LTYNNSRNYITKEHSDYTSKKTLWEFLYNAYYGYGGFKDGTYVDKYEKESTLKYSDRKTRAYYINYCKPIIDTYNGHLFKQSIIRNSDVKILQSFFNKTNAAGDVSLTGLMKQANNIAMIKGYCFVLVDKPDIITETLRDEIENNTYPYAYILEPGDIIDWAVDKHGDFLWAKVKESYIVNNDIPFASHDTVYQYRIWYRDRWELYNATGGKIAGEAHDVGQVPIVLIQNKKVIGTICGVSEIDDIAKINRRLFNLCSELDELLRSQTFAILTYPALDAAQLTDVELGTDRILTYDPASSKTPAFIAPPITATQAYEMRIEKLIEEIYRLARLKFTGGISPSGIALAFDFEKTNQVLCDKAQKLISAEEAILRLVCAWQGEEYGDTSVEYPTDYSLSDIFDEIDHAYNVLSLNLGDTFNKAYKKSLSRKIMTNLSKETLIVVDNEIDTFEELVEPEEVPDDA
jgi:hypothetical protein